MSAAVQQGVAARQQRLRRDMGGEGAPAAAAAAADASGAGLGGQGLSGGSELGVGEAGAAVGGVVGREPHLPPYLLPQAPGNVAAAAAAGGRHAPLVQQSSVAVVQQQLPAAVGGASPPLLLPHQQQQHEVLGPEGLSRAVAAREAPEYLVAWELEVWKKAEEAKWRAELKVRPLPYMP